MMQLFLMQAILGKVLIAGSGSNGLLLNGSTQDLNGFHTVDLSQHSILSLQLGGMFALAINIKRQAIVWGTFSNQILKIPRRLELPYKVKEISCGWNHAVLISQNDRLYGLGENKFNQLTNIKKGFYSQPVEIQTSWRPVKVSCGFRQTYVLNEREQLFGKGQNKNAQFGLDPKVDELGWSTVGIFKSKVVKVGCGKRFVSVLDNLGQLWGCGNNQYKVFKSLPETIHIFTIAEVEVTDFAVGWNHLVYANKSGKVFSYGLNSLGQLGHQDGEQQVIFKGSSILNNIKLFSGTQFSFCLAQQGLFAWGWNEHGNLTDQKTEIISEPVFLPCKAETVITYGAVTILV